MGFSDSIKKFIGIEEDEVFVPEDEVAAAKEDILLSKKKGWNREEVFFRNNINN